MCDAFIQNGFRLLDTVLWRDYKKDTQYEWYYVERRLYLIRSKTTGAIWNVHASNPEDALQKVLGLAGVYNWHDLKKDPKDLPLYDREYLCLVNLNTVAFPSSKQYMVLTRSQIVSLIQNVYGWKEIEPFNGGIRMECRNCEHLRNCKRQCMDLPEGKTCGDCCYIAHCQLFYGVKVDSRRCDFEPIRFRPASGNNVAQEADHD